MIYVVQTSYGPVEVEGDDYTVDGEKTLWISKRHEKVATFDRWEFISIKREEAQ